MKRLTCNVTHMMKELREKNEADIVQFIAEKREELRKLRFGVTGSALRNTRAIRTVKHDIARALTELTSRRTEGA